MVEFTEETKDMFRSNELDTNFSMHTFIAKAAHIRFPAAYK